VKGACFHPTQRVFADPRARMSNALDARFAAAINPMSNALDITRGERRPGGKGRGAPPGRTPHRNARGPVKPALSILGGAKMGTQ
jgi:hypothetical protein